jgi:hypothetical protein
MRNFKLCTPNLIILDRRIYESRQTKWVEHTITHFGKCEMRSRHQLGDLRVGGRTKLIFSTSFFYKRTEECKFTNNAFRNCVYTSGMYFFTLVISTVD